MAKRTQLNTPAVEALSQRGAWYPARVMTLRKLLGWSREGLADNMGSTERSVYRWERGETRMTPGPERAILNVAVQRLTGSQLAELAAVTEGTAVPE